MMPRIQNTRPCAFMKRLRAAGQRARVAGGEEAVDRLGGELAAEHRVVDPLARGRRHHAGGVAGQHHVAAIVPARSGLSGIGAPSRRMVSQPARPIVWRSPATEPRSEKPLFVEPVPMLAVSPCGNTQE